MTHESILQQLEETGQLKRILAHPAYSKKLFIELLTSLVPVDAFYKEMGGVAGYTRKILSLLEKKENKQENIVFHSPTFIDISTDNSDTRKAIDWGIEALPHVAEMIPLGGAADRLHLQDEKTGNELPAAKLVFAGKTLLERIIVDIQAREFLFFQRYGRKIITPIALMTSHEKNNHFHIEKLLEENNFFGRPKDSIRIFTQTLVPVVDDKGDFVFTSDFKLVMKPGGHGAIWKLAHDEGIFSWFQAEKRSKILVRQINNPIAGLDYGLLAFLGLGWKNNKKFGFASCPRLLKAAEGVNVVIEKENTLVLTNVEYCDFEKFGLTDRPLKEGDPHSQFSSNTNLLFGDLSAIVDAMHKCPYPGLILNLKNGTTGRLESTMQNLADVFVEEKKSSNTPVSSFITYNHRHKTISTAKRAYTEGGTLLETPESCFYDLLQAHRELLEKHCAFTMPEKRSLQECLKTHPDFVFLYHPVLGPLYSIIEKKIQKGVLATGSELVLEIADVLLENLLLDGSLQIRANELIDKTSRCVLKNVRVQNQGVNWKESLPFWKGNFVRKQSVEIILKGRSSFTADNVLFEGSHQFVVEDGVAMHLREGPKGFIIEKEKL